MDYIYGLIQILALFLSTLWFFTWLCERRSGPGRLFELKRQLAARWISGRKRTPDDGSAAAMERLIDGVQRKQCDSNVMNYFGADLKNNFIYIKINHRKGEQAELTLFLSLSNGQSYELPDHPNCVISDFGTSSWSGAGLKISILESRRRTRILFNGLLRKGTRSNVNREDDDADIEHVRFNCIFISSLRPYPQEEFWSSDLQAEMLARNSWKKSKWHQLIRELDIDGIDQYGSIIGQVTFEDSSSVELYLRGLRQCQWGKCSASNFERNIRITGLDSIGTIFYINVGDVKDGMKNMHLGHVKYPTQILSPINSLNFDAKHFMDRFESGFDEYEFEFIAGSRKYEAIMKLRRKSGRVLFGGYPWNCQYAYYNFELIVNDTPGIGMIELWQPYSGPCPVKLSPAKRFIKARECKRETLQAYTLSFQDKRCQNESFVGGKAASLAELSSISTTQFIVPKGFCITSHALESHIKYHSNLEEAIDEFVKVCSEEKVGSLKEHSEKVIKLLESTPVLHTVQNEILEALKQLETGESGKLTYAVRSSAVGEDSEETSAAGQNSSFLGVKDANQLMKCVARCWASLYTHQSVEYRRQHGMPVKALMGVCVQRMVDAEAAGVMFTRHPITGNPKEILITSNYGLGEAVVSALVDPDSLIVERKRDGSLSLKSSTIGKKSQKISVNTELEGEGTHCSSLSVEESSKLSISDEVALKLAAVGLALDQLYGSPRDIEWAVQSEDRIYLLQSRPVTVLDAWTDFELTHELGSGVVFDEDILTFANVGEVLSMVLTPLTTSTVIHGLNVGTEYSITKNMSLQTYASHLFITNMRCCLNYMNLMLRFIEEKISLGDRVMDIAVCGHSVLTPEIHAAAKKRNGKIANKSKIFLDMLRDLWNNSEEIQLAGSIVERWRSEKEREASTPRELHRLVGDMVADFSRISACHSHASKCSVFYQVLSMSILTEGSEELTMEHYSDISVLLRSASDVISAQVPVALKEITRTIKESGLSEQFKAVDLSEATNWLRLNCPKAYEQVQEFIKIHGHRGIDEFELITETWGMKPEKFLTTIQSMMNANNNDYSTGKDLSPSEAVALLKSPRKSSTRWVLRWILPLSRQAVAQRETTKALLIEMVNYLRLTYLQLADSLLKQGRLPERQLVFFLTHQELAEVTEGPRPMLLRKAARRRKLRASLQKHKYKEVNYGMPKPIQPTQAFTPSGISMQGTSVCNGLVTGRACVALTVEEAAQIRAGDILITTATDIGWSPFFPLLGGVVTELGGLISHGAVVAREYGLPCIVGVENATRTFKTGEIVSLNGYAGTIEIVNEAVKVGI